MFETFADDEGDARVLAEAELLLIFGKNDFLLKVIKSQLPLFLFPTIYEVI